MSAQITLSAPSTLTVLAGAPTLSSLGVVANDGITVSGAAAADTLGVEIIATNPLASLWASTAGGATVSSTAGTLWITGSEVAVNAALASLQVAEPGNTGTDTLSLTVSDPNALPAQTGIAVDVVPPAGPAFVAPPGEVNLPTNAPVTLSGLAFTDPVATGLAQAGLGREETLSLTLSVTQGALLLPGFSPLAGIAAQGIGSGTIELSFTADESGAVNKLLAGLEVATPPTLSGGGENLNFALWNESGVLPSTVTSGQVFLRATGEPGGGGSFANGGQTLLLGNQTLASTLAVTGVTAVLGNMQGTGAVMIAPGAALQMGANALFLSGTSLDDGTLVAGELLESGTLVAGEGAVVNGEVSLGSLALLDFAGTLIAGAEDVAAFTTDLSLAARAVLTGDGTLVAGNFSESGLIDGPGTILAQTGATLEIDAGMVSGGALLAVEGGGVMVLGPVAPVYGVFDSTPLTVDNSVTLSFSGAGGEAIAGGYAGTLGGTGGAFVINGPQVFSGTVTGFAPGDELIFPTLTDVGVENVGTTSFQVTGLDDIGVAETFTIVASLAVGDYPYVGQDSEGDDTVYLHQTSATISQAVALAASAGVAQRLPGLSLVLAAGTTQSLKLTLTSGHGTLSLPGLAGTNRLLLAEPSLAAMNAELAVLTYTGTGTIDALTITSNYGVLAGLNVSAPIVAGAAGTVNAWGGEAYTAAEWVQFGAMAGLPVVSTPIVPGALQVMGPLELDGLVQASGLSGTALVVDDGGLLVTGAAATLDLNGGVTVGDNGGAGTLNMLGGVVSASGNITFGVGGSADILGTLEATGSLNLGTAQAVIGGALSVAGVTLAGTLTALAGATLALGGVSNAGTLVLDTGVAVSAASYTGAGTLVLGGGDTLALTGGLVAGALTLGTDAVLSATSAQLAGGTFADAGLLTLSGAAQVSGTAVELQGGTLAASTLTLQANVTGAGVLAAAGGISATGAIEAQGGRLLVAGNLTEVAGITVAASAALELTAGLSGVAVAFAGAAGLITLDDVAQGFAGVTQMVASDAIDLVGVAPSLVSYGGGSITVENALGSAVTSFALGGGSGVSLVSDGADGTLITLDGELPCFARGTGILTPQGYVPVEQLKPGDPVITATGTRRPVRWLGWRTLDFGPAGARHAQPVVILPGAFGPGRPARALRLSPRHGVYVGGVIIPVTHLVNGATVLRETGTTATTYYHVELDRHDILLADGLECESYLDSANREQFSHSLGQRHPALRAFAPRVTSGAALAAARRLLHKGVLAAGFTRSFWPSLHAVAAGAHAVPEITALGPARLAHFTFPAPVRTLTLVSATSCPADTDPESEDRRALGVCLGEVPQARLGAGWLPRGPADAGAWMGARAELAFKKPVRELVLPLVAIAPTWRRKQRLAVDAPRLTP